MKGCKKVILIAEHFPVSPWLLKELEAGLRTYCRMLVSAMTALVHMEVWTYGWRQSLRNSNPGGSLKKNYFFTLGAVDATLASTRALM